MSFATLSGVLAAAVATSGTFSGGYPNDAYGVATSRGDFVNGTEHKLSVAQKLFSAPEDFTIAFGATTWTITWNGANTLRAGASYRVQLDMPGIGALRVGDDGTPVLNTTTMAPVYVDLGNPVAASAVGVAAVALLGAAGDLPLTTAAGVTLDVPRNLTLTVATTNQSGVTFTAYGTDAYGNALVESIAGPNANTVALKKAFKRVTRVAASAAIATNGVSVGWGDVLGLPLHVPITGEVLKEIEDSAIASAGTLVAGLSPLTKPTISNADIRGTYDPASACDGSKAFALIVLVPDPGFKGQTQFTA